MTNDSIYKKQNVQAGELAMYEFLNTIADIYNPDFSTAQLPKAIAIDYDHHCIDLPFYEGETFEKKWTEVNGGVPLGLDLSIEAPLMLKDLSAIDISGIDKNTRLAAMPKIRFSHEDYLDDFAKLCEGFVNSEIITPAEKDAAEGLLNEEGPTSPVILNNGDFYPRNFIRMADNKIVIIDWETWNPHSRAFILDHVENVAAYCFVGMWDNYPWQKNYVQHLRKLFDVQRKDFQKAILIKAADSAVFWIEVSGQHYLRSPMALFKKALTDDYMQWLWP